MPEDYEIDFAIVDNVGHDKDGKVTYKLNKDGTKLLDIEGKPVINDDLIDLNLKLRQIEEFNFLKEQKEFRIKASEIKNNIYIPNYYAGVERILKKLAEDKAFSLTISWTSKFSCSFPGCN